jgi:hypothetical protein
MPGPSWDLPLNRGARPRGGLEIESPDDETWDKLDFYGERGADEVPIVSRLSRSVTWFGLWRTAAISGGCTAASSVRSRPTSPLVSTGRPSRPGKDVTATSDPHWRAFDERFGASLTSSCEQNIRFT